MELSLDWLEFGAMPERNPAPDPLRGWTRFLVEPGGVSVDLVTDNDVVVAGKSLPVAGRVAVTAAQVLLAHVSQRKVLIALHDNRICALRQDSVVPGCTVALGHGLFGRRRDSI